MTLVLVALVRNIKIVVVKSKMVFKRQIFDAFLKEIMKDFIVEKKGKLSKLVLIEFPELTFKDFMVALKNKDIRVDGVRVNKDVLVESNSLVSVYIDFNKIATKIEKVYEDDNILIIFKPYGLEVVGNKNDVVSILKKNYLNLYPCHRIDVNTEGLVVFAKNKKSEETILSAFKNHNVKKVYKAWTAGHFKEQESLFKAYLKKDSNKSVVHISTNKGNGYKEILTKVNILEDLKTTSLIQVELLTGRTHQIRAHLSFLKHSIIGDDKYGDREQNKKFGLKKQALTSCEISFQFKNTHLDYLNNKSFKAVPTWLKYLDKDR